MTTLSQIQEEIGNVLFAFNQYPMIDGGNADTAEVEHYLDELAQAEENKVEAYLRVESKMHSAVEWLKAEGNALLAKAKTLQAEMDWRKSYVLKVMQEHGLQKLKGRSGSITRQEGTPKLMIDMERLPASYKRTVYTVEADKDAIKNALNGGLDVPGAELVAGEHVRFNRPKVK